jgi:hypothetical protein
MQATQSGSCSPPASKQPHRSESLNHGALTTQLTAHPEQLDDQPDGIWYVDWRMLNFSKHSANLVQHGRVTFTHQAVREEVRQGGTPGGMSEGSSHT